MTSQCWSPDGRSIALHFGGNSLSASDGRIEVVDLEGKTVRTIGLQAFPDATQRSIRNLDRLALSHAPRRLPGRSIDS